MKCKHCNFRLDNLYAYVTQNARSIAAPLTQAGVLESLMEDLTGKRYVPLKPEFCPMCGEVVTEVVE